MAALDPSSSSSSSSTAAKARVDRPLPKSPPKCPDMSGKRRELAKIQVLERETGYLEEELRTFEELQPASQSCKEVHDFVVTRSDPLIPTNQKRSRSSRFWKRLCKQSCFNLSWICCFSGCTCKLKPWSCFPACSCCNSENWLCFLDAPCCFCNCRPRCNCLKNTSCRRSCSCKTPSCPDCSNCCRCRCRCSCPDCTKVCSLCSCSCRPCSNCINRCCNSCLFC